METQSWKTVKSCQYINGIQILTEKMNLDKLDECKYNIIDYIIIKRWGGNSNRIKEEIIKLKGGREKRNRNINSNKIKIVY